jgi:competence protein ComGC
MNDRGQWIVLLGFIISIILVFLALIVNQSALVGKTTSESVLEFPKTQIQDFRSEVLELYSDGRVDDTELRLDIYNISMVREGAVVYYENQTNGIFIHYNDGTTDYNEIIRR